MSKTLKSNWAMVDNSSLAKPSKKKRGGGGAYRKHNAGRVLVSDKTRERIAKAREQWEKPVEVADRDENGKLRLKFNGHPIMVDKKSGERYIQPRTAKGHFGPREYFD